MIPDFAGKVIEIVRLDWSLQIWTADDYSLVLSEPVVVTTADDEGARQVTVRVDVEPGPVPEPLAGLEGATIIQVLVSREGDLSIQLSDRHLTVQASPRHEAWQVNAPGGETFISSPGGGLTHFPHVVATSPTRDGDLVDRTPSVTFGPEQVSDRSRGFSWQSWPSRPIS